MQRTMNRGVAGTADGRTDNIAVVVPAYNAGKTLHRCLSALLAAGFSPSQLIVVDDASQDATRAIAAEFGIEPITLTRNGGAAVARNTGARAANADILFFVDADVVVHPGARERIERFFRERPDYAAVFGAYDAAPPEGGVVSRFRNLLHRHVHVINGGEASTFWTGCGAVRRQVFEAAGGFDPDEKWVMIEDVVLGVAIKRNNGRIWLDPELQCVHLKAWTLQSMMRTDMRHRAMPWTRLLRREAETPFAATLNVDAKGRLSVLSVAASMLALPVMPFLPAMGFGLFATAWIALGVLNRGFIAMMFRVRGLGEAAASLPLLWLHYLAAGLGFVFVRLGLSKID